MVMGLPVVRMIPMVGLVAGFLVMVVRGLMPVGSMVWLVVLAGLLGCSVMVVLVVVAVWILMVAPVVPVAGWLV